MAIAGLIAIVIAIVVPDAAQAQMTGPATGAGEAGKFKLETVTKAPIKQFITISTNGFYSPDYPIGSAICKIINQKSATHAIYCSIRRSSGSVMNINRLRRNEADFAIVQSNIAKQAVDGSAHFEDPTPFAELRGVAMLYTVQAVIVAGPKSKAERFLDFVGTRFNIGPPNSDSAVIFESLQSAYGIGDKEFKALTIVDDLHLADALCNDSIDGALEIGGNPNEVLSRAVDHCGSRLLPIEPGAREQILARNRQLVPTEIPAGTYERQPGTINTVGIAVLLVTTKAVPSAIVSVVARAIAEELPQLRRAHRSMQGVSHDDLMPRLTFLPMADAVRAALQ